jgi:hypothetical protein
MEKPDRRAVAIVDAYSTGSRLAAEFGARGWQCVHVRSGSFILEILRPTFSEKLFARDVTYTGDLPALVAELRALGVSYVIPGTETDGVLLADQISDALDLPGNSPGTCSQRRNKYEMVEAVRAAGLKATRQIKTGSAEAALNWVRRNLADGWPVVVKPVNSTATDGVHFCQSENELRRCFENLVGRRNCLGLPNDELLVQELLRGREYTVNMVSWEGKHRLTEIFEMHKVVIPGFGAMYDTMRLLPWTGRVQGMLVDYLSRVLDALGHRFGPSHNELMLTEDGPCLIESGARLAGSLCVDALEPAQGTHQVRRTVEVATEGSVGEEVAVDPVRKHLWYVFLFASRDGRLVDMPLERTIRELPSFFSLHVRANKGTMIRKTVDLLSSPGYTILSHTDGDVIERDYQQIRQQEGEGFVLAAS